MTSPPEKRSVQPSFFAGGSPPKGLPGTSQGIEIEQTLPYDPPGTSPYFFLSLIQAPIHRFIQLTKLRLFSRRTLERKEGWVE